MMTQIDEINNDRHFEMSYVEFLEAISRVAWQAKFPEPGKNPNPEHKLVDYIENIMPRLVELCSKATRDLFRYPPTSPYFKPLKGFRRMNTIVANNKGIASMM